MLQVQLVGSKRIGGTGDDGVNISDARGLKSLQQNYGDDGRSEVILDGSTILVASTSQSRNTGNSNTTGFPIVGGFQTQNAGEQDGVFFKVSSDVSTLLYSTYLGGAANDAAYVLSISPLTGDIYIGRWHREYGFCWNRKWRNWSSFSSMGKIDGFVTRTYKWWSIN